VRRRLRGFTAMSFSGMPSGCSGDNTFIYYIGL
jgi:hypothetical protein